MTATLGSDDKAALRALVRDELRAALSAQAAASATAPAPSASAAPDVPALVEALGPELRARYDSGRRLVDDGIQRRRWTEDDRANLNNDVQGLSAAIIVSVLDPLIIAVNRGDVRFEGKGPLF